MAEQNPPVFIQAGLHPAEDVRRFIGAVSEPGVVGVADLKVSQRAGTVDMSVDVAAGRAFIAGNVSGFQGTYFVESRDVVNLPLAAADPSLSRVDRIVAVVRDSGYGGETVDGWSLEVVTGTPGAPPSAPAAPPSSITLAQVIVPAAASAITNATIADGRPLPSSLRRVTMPGTGTANIGTAPSPFTGALVYASYREVSSDASGFANLTFPAFPNAVFTVNITRVGTLTDVAFQTDNLTLSSVRVRAFRDGEPLASSPNLGMSLLIVGC